MPRAAPKPSHVTKCYGLHDPLNPEDSEVQTALTPLYVKTLVQAAWMISWRARKSVMTRW